ncbi:hypothetical protein GCM10007079_35410 [Nocardiopsis terrae]|uniref:DUF4352 domain-containing protein n=1 Tax=Nocardiopsis terrae TaxID=372655 RepID=A0ABR9HD66_9ACTN|nr:DUF4352 domain-containing protein [Nocardiopsis terrae]MBE1456939.1 hypothetical protein [Nocardiopsis terrae]GHC89709.1 hypothetical protein GCM10007079_35410 [Nocardiopsis terrae]
MYPHPQSTPPGLSIGRKIFLGVGGTTIVVLLGAIAVVIATPSGDDPGSGSEQTASSTVQDQSPSPSSQTRDPQSQPQPTQNEEEPEDTLGIGDSFEVDGFSVTVDEVRVSTDPVQDTLFDESHAPGGKWVIVKYTVTNVSDDPEGWYQTVRVRTDEGRSYSEEYDVGTALSFEESSEVVLDINPDDSAVQHAAVDIPEGAQPDQAEFPDLMGNSTVVSLDY